MNAIYYIGDSTVQFNKIDTYPQTGMSQVLSLFTAEGVTVHPHGKNGRSTKSFLEEGRFESVRENLSEGDFLLIQFGHNDEKADPARYTEPYGSYQENLRFFINEARAAGAYPVLITPIARRLFDETGNFLPGSHGEYPEAVRQVGEQEGVPVADLTALTEAFLAELGDEPSKPLFVWPKDNTHLKYDGAVKMAELLCRELKKLGSPYADLLYKPYELQPGGEVTAIDSPYFTMAIMDVANSRYEDLSSFDSFVVYIALSGNMKLRSDAGEETLAEGELVLIPAEMPEIEIEGDGRLMKIYIK
jgi:lysophospholipase L1-like esterase